MRSRLGLGQTSVIPNAVRGDVLNLVPLHPAIKITNKGFTLIEILVVILIIGITLGFALMSFGDFGEKRRIIVAAEQFKTYVNLVQQQAILETSTFGIGIHKNGYQIVRFQPPGRWVSMSSKSIFHDQHFPNGLVVHLKAGFGKPGAPAIIITSSGDMNPFRLDFGTKQQETMITIIGQRNGALRMVKVKTP